MPISNAVETDRVEWNSSNRVDTPIARVGWNTNNNNNINNNNNQLAGTINSVTADITRMLAETNIRVVDIHSSSTGDIMLVATPRAMTGNNNSNECPLLRNRDQVADMQQTCPAKALQEQARTQRGGIGGSLPPPQLENF